MIIIQASRSDRGLLGQPHKPLPWVILHKCSFVRRRIAYIPFLLLMVYLKVTFRLAIPRKVGSAKKMERPSYGLMRLWWTDSNRLDKRACHRYLTQIGRRIIRLRLSYAMRSHVYQRTPPTRYPGVQLIKPNPTNVTLVEPCILGSKSVFKSNQLIWKANPLHRFDGNRMETDGLSFKPNQVLNIVMRSPYFSNLSASFQNSPLPTAKFFFVPGERWLELGQTWHKNPSSAYCITYYSPVYSSSTHTYFLRMSTVSIVPQRNCTVSELYQPYHNVASILLLFAYVTTIFYCIHRIIAYLHCIRAALAVLS